MKYTRKMISEAPRFAVGIDYKASYEIEILNEYGHIIHHHTYEGTLEEAQENARMSRKWHSGYDWRVIRIK